MVYKIGIPRGLLFFNYYPCWERFFQEIGMEVILSPRTNKKIIDDGIKLAVDELCLPFKAYYGHVLDLIDRVDYLFVPRFISLGKDNCVCPKFMGLPDMLKATFPKIPPLLEPVVDMRKGFFPLRKIAHKIGKELGVNYWKVERAYEQALKRQKIFEEIQKKGFTYVESIEILKKGKLKSSNKTVKNPLRIAVLGHSYITNDNYLSMDIIEKLREMGIDVLTHEMIEPKLREKAAKRQGKKLFWFYNRQIMGSAYYFLFESRKKIDGIIQITAFGCGPDSLVKELVDIKGKGRKDISILDLNVDEHSGNTGLITRLEAFIDLLERKRMV